MAGKIFEEIIKVKVETHLSFHFDFIVVEFYFVLHDC